jgi:predicted metal-dependent HD superfamily phosphohydrolase
MDCLGKLDRTEAEAEDAPHIRAALWFHDVIYDSHAGDNEQRSADLAYRTGVDAGLPEIVCRKIADLVMATDHRTDPTTTDARLICDIDLSILGETEERFRDYDRQIAQEYAWVPQAHYREKRAEVLEGFLRRPRIYRTDLFFRELEVAARRNLERLVCELRG